MLLLFLALTFLSSALVPISSPLRPAPRVTFPPPILRAGSDACLPPLPAGRGPGQAGARCLHPAPIGTAARTTVAVEKSS